MMLASRNWLRATALVPLAFAAVAPARADCDHFKWSIANERAWFAAAPASLPATGGAAEPGKAYALSLAKDAKLPVAPERAPAADRYFGVVTLPKLAPGLYQITLSQEAWIDVAADGALVKSSDFSGQKDCPGVRKSVRFKLAGPVTVEISNASVDNLLFAISAAN
jgi:hypothetical protein